MTTITIALPTDAALLHALEERCFVPSERFPQRTWHHLLGLAARRGTALTLVVREHAAILGAIVGLYRAGSTGVRIYSLAVDPETRGRGLGRLLVHSLLRHSRQRCRWVGLEVRSDNPVRGLYEKLGMEQAGSLPGYYGHRRHGVRYRGDLLTMLDRSRPVPVAREGKGTAPLPGPGPGLRSRDGSRADPKRAPGSGAARRRASGPRR